MNENAPQPEEEKLRYLLPDGCKDLIDALPKQEPTRMMMHVVDQDGNLLELLYEIPKPESVPVGLSALSSYVSRLFTSANPSASLLVSTADNCRGFGLARQGAEIQLFFSFPAHGESKLQESVHALLASHAIPPTLDYFSSENTIRHVAYLLPPSPESVTTICHKLLLGCFGVQRGEALHFVLNQVTQPQS